MTHPEWEIHWKHLIKNYFLVSFTILTDKFTYGTPAGFPLPQSLISSSSDSHSMASSIALSVQHFFN
jgi:hypothetical protein